MSGKRVLRSLAALVLLVSLGRALGVPLARADSGNEVFSVRRFLLSAGSNHGDGDRVELRFADSDARAVSKVFEDLGGVDPADQILLLDAQPAALRQALAALGRRMSAAAKTAGRVELLVYYSGHSDEQGLLLEGERLSYRELRSAIDQLPADVRIIILDSCASGALTRLKGGSRRPPFLLDTSTKLAGHAFLTSSSYDEAAQESDRLGGSFFTHALLSGLRGAADATQDHRVTLNEAYQFAYQNTLARTEGTQSGPQHPGYDIQMVGAGDLVMTDLHNLTAGLVLTKELEGRLNVRDGQDDLVVELQKPRGREVELGLEPGDYRVVLDRDGRYSSAAISVAAGNPRQLTEADFQPMAAADTRTRGDFSTAPPGSRSDRDIVRRDLLISLWPGMSNARTEDARTVADYSLNLTIGRNFGVDGAEFGALGNWNLGDVNGFQVSGVIDLVEGSIDGFQSAGVVNRVGHRAKALQFAGVANSVGGDVVGGQSAGVVNVARAVRGAQVAGVVNLARGPVGGAQISGSGNYAPSLRGLQLSVVNLCGNTSGAQIGVVNLAGTVHGTQIGVVNVANEVSGAPVGILSFVRHGRHQLAAWNTDVTPFNLGVKLGNRNAYTILTAGGESLDKDNRWFGGCGLGVEVPYGRFFGQIEAVSYRIAERRRTGDHNDDGLHLLNRATLGLGRQVGPRLAIVGGVAVNVFTSRRNDGEDLVGRTSWYDDRKGPVYTRAWPGYFVGLQF
jgi:hypothetical protein